LYSSLKKIYCITSLHRGNNNSQRETDNNLSIDKYRIKHVIIIVFSFDKYAIYYAIKNIKSIAFNNDFTIVKINHLKLKLCIH